MIDFIILYNDIIIIDYYIIKVEDTIRLRFNEVHVITTNIIYISKGLIAVYA